MAANKWEVILTPGAWRPDATSHPSMGMIYNRTYLAFDPSADEICYSKSFRLPDAYAGGTVTAEVCFAMQTDNTSTYTVAFNLAVEALPDGGTDDTDANNYFDTGNAISSTIPDTAGKVKIASARRLLTKTRWQRAT